jgi:sarcosine oxidase subunit gamma
VTADSARRSPLARLDLPTHDAVQLREVPFLTHINLRIDPVSDTASRIAQALGVRLPADPNTVAAVADRTVLWLGPDEWLIVGPNGDAPSVQALLRNALKSGDSSIVDISAHRTTLELAGPAAREVLEKGCPIDLHPRAFGLGHCAQTLLARATIILWPTAPDTYRILVRASLAEYVTEWLIDASQESECLTQADLSRPR